jgi:hypothetical protein
MRIASNICNQQLQINDARNVYQESMQRTKPQQTRERLKPNMQSAILFVLLFVCL